MSPEKKVVVLTGYAGFIGSQLLRDLVAKGYCVIGLDNLSEGSDIRNYEKFLNRDMYPEVFLMKVNIANPHLEQILVNPDRDPDIDKNYRNGMAEDLYHVLDYDNGGGIDYVINCAAQSHVDRSWGDYDEFIRSNIHGPINLAKMALNLSFGGDTHSLGHALGPNAQRGQNTRPERRRLKCFVQVSTDEVFDPMYQPFSESSKIRPSNIYSSSKASAEMFLRNYYEAYALPLILTNGANTYGPRQYHEKIIPKTIKLLLEGKKIPVFETPAQRMWLHVKDHSAGIIAAMESHNIGRRYCLAPRRTCELYTHDLVSSIAELMGLDSTKVIEYVPDRVNYDLRYLMDNTAAVSELKWSPDYHIVKELPGLIEYYKNEFCNK